MRKDLLRVLKLTPGRRPRPSSRKKRLRMPSVSMPWSVWLPKEKMPSARGKKRSKSSKKGAGGLKRPQERIRRRSFV